MSLNGTLVIFDKKVKVEGTVEDDFENIRRRNRKEASRRWKGPKTDERINQMLVESIRLLKDLGVPISDSICPDVTLTGTHCSYGRCCPKGSRKKYTEYDYYIEISGHTLNNTEKSLRNTLIHELIHTVPGGLCHTGQWKIWAKYVSEKTGYKIQRLGGDETEEDNRNLMTASSFDGILNA